MCGICGLINKKGTLKREWIIGMNSSLRHRGPDDEGYLVYEEQGKRVLPLTGDDSRVSGEHIGQYSGSPAFLFGHRRLSIIDVSATGHQPMPNQDQTVWILYNGEIYNYLELREELSGLGHKFQTGSDTEVILAAYDQWGADCLERFNGMWSFVLFDSKQKRIFGARDRFGVKPFFYFNNQDIFAFASEIKALMTLPFAPRKINPEALFDYLVIGLEEWEEETMFRGIFELPPSHAFTFDIRSQEFRKWRYYQLSYFPEWKKPDNTKTAKYIEEIKALLFDAVNIRLRSDVPVGSCVSGGIDSSALVGIINELLGKNPAMDRSNICKAYTVSYPGMSFDETAYARLAVERAGFQWFRVEPTATEMVADLKDLIRTQELPFGSTCIYAHYRVSRLAAENGTKVLLDGQGGDEIFAGYKEFYRSFFLEMLKSGDFSRFFREFRMIGHSPVTRSVLLGQIRNTLLKKMIPGFLKSIYYKNRHSQNRWIRESFWKNQRDRIHCYKGRDFFSLNRTLFEFMTRFQLKTILRYEDRNSMRFSIESRTPFSDDHRLIEYLFSIPSSYKIFDGSNKFLLRRAMEGLVPPEILNRKDKIGFITPVSEWMSEASTALKSYFTPELDEFLRTEDILREWEGLLRSKTIDGINPFWRLVNFAVWKEEFQLKS